MFAINDLLIDAIYFARRLWRSATVNRRYPRAFGRTLADRSGEQRFIAIFVPAWDESTVIASMLRLSRLEYVNYRIFVGWYRNDPATAAAISSIDDPRIEPVFVHTEYASGVGTGADSRRGFLSPLRPLGCGAFAASPHVGTWTFTSRLQASRSTLC